MELNKALSWRYATQIFDTTKKVSDVDLQKILTAGNLMPTSFGLQPFRIITISDTVKAKLFEATWGQKHMVENSNLIVIAIRTDIDVEMIAEYAARIEKTRGMPEGGADRFKAAMVNDLTHRSAEARISWATNQAYIALGGMIAAASLLGVDNHAAEGFIPDQYDAMLGLKEKNLHPVVLLALGYRAESDTWQNFAKVRVASGEMIIKY